MTVINVLKPDDAEKSSVLTLLKEGIDETMKKQKGFISSHVHASLDNPYIINYSQWKSMQDLAHAGELVNSGGAPKMAEAFGKSNADFHPFKLVSQYRSNPKKDVLIDALNHHLTIINILTPKEGTSSEQLIAQLNKALGEELLSQAGFISSTVHQSLDNNLVINYTQWKDEASLQTMVKRLQAGNAPELAQAFSMATPDFHPFSIASSHFKP